jgi:hypothetical protein
MPLIYIIATLLMAGRWEFHLNFELFEQIKNITNG